MSDIDHTSVFLGQSLKAIEIKTKINKWDIIKLTSFCIAKEAINKMKRQTMEWERERLEEENRIQEQQGKAQTWTQLQYSCGFSGGPESEESGLHLSSGLPPCDSPWWGQD